MSFLCNGSNHRTGISNEEYITERLNTDLMSTIFPLNHNHGDLAVHIGGTGGKADCVLIDGSFRKDMVSSVKEKVKIGQITIKKSLSIKKKEKETGTFDWNNTTAWIKKNINSMPLIKLKDIHSRSRIMRKTLSESQRAMNKNGFNKNMMEACDETLSNFNDEIIRNLIQDEMLTPNKNEDVIIRIIATDHIYHFSFSSHPMHKYMADADNIFSLKKKNKGAKGSRTIFVQNRNNISETIDTGVRIRLHSNNGASAMLGISNSNKDSAFCIKFQQDNFDDIKNIAKLYK
jgi:hypothetical protein